MVGVGAGCWVVCFFIISQLIRVSGARLLYRRGDLTGFGEGTECGLSWVGESVSMWGQSNSWGVESASRGFDFGQFTCFLKVKIEGSCRAGVANYIEGGDFDRKINSVEYDIYGVFFGIGEVVNVFYLYIYTPILYIFTSRDFDVLVTILDESTLI